VSGRRVKSRERRVERDRRDMECDVTVLLLALLTVL